jgi:hypothetical protein
LSAARITPGAAWLLSTGPRSPPPPTSCAIKEARSEKIAPPGTLWFQGGAGLGWVCSGGSNLAPRPLGSVAVDRHRGSGLAPLPLLRTGGCRPGAGAARVLGSYRPLPVAAALSTCPGPGTGSGSATGSDIPSCCSKTQNAFRPAKAKAKGSWFLYLRIHMPISTVWRLAII